jgi:hypothetical protein
LRQFGRLATSVGSMGTWFPARRSIFPPGGSAIVMADSPARRLQALPDEIASVRSRLQPVPAEDDDLPTRCANPSRRSATAPTEIQRGIDASSSVIATP